MNELNQNLDRYFRDLKFRYKFFLQNKKLTDKYLATDFQVFDYIIPDENRLSDIIVNLLNPNGTHGQGSIFLELFLSTIENILKRNRVTGANLSKLKSVKLNLNSYKINILREVLTSNINASQRRMDILATIGNLGIMIENKPWALDQEKQLVDYLKNLKLFVCLQRTPPSFLKLL